MLAMKTILHPTDFSPRSEAALRLAEALARDYGAELLLLHVAEPPIVAYGEGLVPPIPEDYQEQLEQKLAQLQLADPQVGVRRILIEGNPAEEILRTAERQHVDVIVMGTHGRTGLGRLLMGSVAELVVRRAACPVLTMKMPAVAVKAPEKPAEEAYVQPLGIS